MEFNSAPYFDDHDFTKNYKKILFKAGAAIQARELNQIQSIFQSEIGAFADHMFKNGSKISNCRTAFTRKSYVRVEANDVDGNAIIEPQGIIRVFGVTSKVEATYSGFARASDSDPDTLFVQYTKAGGDNGDVKTFLHGEHLQICDEFGNILYTWTVRCPTCANSTSVGEISPTGETMFYTIDEGVIYYNQMFIAVKRQEIIITKYMTFDANNIPLEPRSFKVGLDFIDSVVTVAQDESLYDNSLGWPNEGAPGADRYFVELKLVQRSYDDDDGERFILLAKVQPNYRVTFSKEDVEYGDIMREMARRTYETNGNFTVAPFTATFLEARKRHESDSLGYMLNGREDQIVAEVTPGIAYVSGYRVSESDKVAIMIDKARDTAKRRHQTTRLMPFRYIEVDVVSNDLLVSGAASNDILDQTLLTAYDNYDTATNQPSGNAVGTLKVIDQQRLNSNRFALYLYEINMNTGKQISDIRGVKTSNNRFVAKTVLTDGKCVLNNADKDSLLYSMGSDFVVKSQRSIDDSTRGSIQVQLRRKYKGTADAAGVITFTSTPLESFQAHNDSNNFLNVDGVTVALTPSQISVVDNTLMITGLTPHATVVYHATVEKYNQTEKTKTLVTSTATFPYDDTKNIGDAIDLQKADVFRIKSISLIEDNNVNFVPIDVMDQFKHVRGDTPFYYGVDTLQRVKTHGPLSGSFSLRVTFDYFDHSGTQGYFTIDSYMSLVDQNIITYSELMEYVIFQNDQFKADVTFVDFRPLYINGQFTSVSVPLQGSSFVSDIEYYLARADLMQITKDQQITVKRGVPAINPTPPTVDEGGMALYEIYLGAFTFSAANSVRTKFIDNRRFTMKQIAAFDDRISKLEYYTALNALESDTVNMSITDENGLNRYKNGFIVDGFKNFQACDITYSEYASCIDRERGEMRPPFAMYHQPMTLNAQKSQNIRVFGGIALGDYDEVEFSGNPYATKTVSINPYLVPVRKGTMVLTPNVDTWSDTQKLPHIVSNIDAGVDALRRVANTQNLMQSDWSQWVDVNTTTLREDTTGKDEVSDTRVLGNKNSIVTTTSVTSQSRSRTTTTIDSRTEKFSVDDVVKDVKMVPYMREAVIRFVATHMKPRSQVHAFFDGVNVDQYCRPLAQVQSGDPRLAIVGLSPLVVDDNGEVVGEFHLPGGVFFTGDRKFVLIDSESLTNDTSAHTTYAESVYFGGGIAQTKQSSTLNIVTPLAVQTTYTDSRTVTKVTREQTVALPVTVTMPPAAEVKAAPIAPPPSPVPVPVVVPVVPPPPQDPQAPLWANLGPSQKKYENGRWAVYFNGDFTMSERELRSLEEGEFDAYVQTNGEAFYNLRFGYFIAGREDTQNGRVRRNKVGDDTWSVKISGPRRNMYTYISGAPTPTADWLDVIQNGASCRIKQAGSPSENFSTWYESGRKVNNAFANMVREGNAPFWIWIQPDLLTTSFNLSNEFRGLRSSDPLAQAFKVDESCFVTRIDLYFASVDTITGDNIWVEIRDMVNGYPSNNALARKVYSPNILANSVSTDGRTAFPVVFDIPVFVDKAKSYCFVVGGHSPDTRLFVSRLGDKILGGNGKVVEEPPLLWTSFRSLNGETWTAEQLEFIKHTLYQAHFKSLTTKFTFENAGTDDVLLPEDPIEFELGTSKVRVTIPDHGLKVNDTFKLSVCDRLSFNVQNTNDTPPQIGHYFKTVHGSGTVHTVERVGVSGVYKITLTNVVGTINAGTAYQCDAAYRDLNSDLLDVLNINKPRTLLLGESLGTVTTSIYDSLLTGEKIGGATLDKFNTTHQVKWVDSPDSVVVEVDYTFNDATAPNKVGGKVTRVKDVARKYDTFNVSCEHLAYNTTSTLTMVGYSASTVQATAPQPISLNTNHNLPAPNVVYSNSGEVAAIGTNKSLTVTMEFASQSNLLSPVINCDTMSATLVSNRCYPFTPDKMNVAPNAANRFVPQSANNASGSHKYFTNDVLLNNPASDLKIYCDVYKDVDADFDIYVKVAAAGDLNYANKPWIKLPTNKINSRHLNDFHEYTLSLNGASGYTPIEFNWFKVKFVSHALNSSKPVIVKNLRCVAVT